ncbi:hypothetical protein FI667_g14681, partial [Globisporangium splendens]
MASFSFNFTVDDSATDEGATQATASLEKKTYAPAAPTPTHHTRHGERFHWQPSAAITAAEFSLVQIPIADPPVEFALVNTTDQAFLSRTGAIRSILTTSDLQAGVYEGGFKLWECAVDLVKYVELLLRANDTTTGHPLFCMPSKVMELGCADHVVFMDYNKEVLELTTCPNVLRNAGGDASIYAKASFYAGAWASVSEYMQDMEGQSHEETQYDLILTAETIYTEAVTIELYEMIKRHLRQDPASMALVSAKKYYFGTNGSMQHFLDVVQSEGIFKTGIVWEERDYRSNIREIVKVTYA